MNDSLALRRLAGSLATLQGDVDSLKRWQSTPQAIFSSIDNGSIPEYDENGDLVSIIGKQPDGSHGIGHVNGPVPPTPSAPVVEGGSLLLTAIWDGTYTAGQTGKADFSTMEVYAAPAPFTSVEEATRVGVIGDPDGGRVSFARPVGTWYIGLVALSLAGKRSAVSELATGEAAIIMDEEARAENERLSESMGEAWEQLGNAQDWISEEGTRLVSDLAETAGAVNTVADLLAEVRANTGRRQWQDTFTHTAGGVDWFTVHLLGDGWLRLEWLYNDEPIEWYAEGDRHQGHTFEWQAPFAGSVTLVVTQLADGTTYQIPFTVTEAMMGPGGEWVDAELPPIDWSDAEIGLEQLRLSGHLDPDLWEHLSQELVVGTVVGATEAFIGQNAILEGHVLARHIAASEDLSAKVASFLRVTTDMQYVGGMNRLPDPHLRDADLTARREGRGTASYQYWVPSTATADVRAYAIPCEPGETYRVEVPVTMASAFTTTGRVESWGADGTGRQTHISNGSTLEDGVLAWEWTVPEGHYYFAPFIYRTGVWEAHPGATVHLMASSRLIVDGGITGRHVNILEEGDDGSRLHQNADGLRIWGPNAGTQPNFSATLSDGIRLMDNNGDSTFWVDPATGRIHTAGGLISGGDIEGTTITAAEIIGPTVMTSRTGRRATLDVEGLRAYATSGTGQQTVNIDGVDNWLAGQFHTGPPGEPRMSLAAYLDPTIPGGHIPQMVFSPTGQPLSTDAAILSGYEWDGSPIWDLLLKAAGRFNADRLNYIRFDGPLSGLPRGTIYSRGAWQIRQDGEAIFDGGVYTNDITPVSGGVVNIQAVDRIGLAALNDRIDFEGGGMLRAAGIRANTNPNAANVFINSSGRLYFGTSSREAKDAIEPAPEEWAARLLDVEPTTFYDKANNERYAEYLSRCEAGLDPDPADLDAVEPIRRIPGLIAEDVEAAGLGDYVTYNDDGTVSGYSDRLWTLLIPLVRDHEARLAALEAQLATT